MTTAKKKESKTPRPTAGERAHSLAMEREALLQGLAMEREALLQENDQLKREVREQITERHCEARALAKDMRKRVDDLVVKVLLKLSDDLGRDSTSRAQAYVLSGGSAEDVPSSVSVLAEASEEVTRLAERYAGRPLSLRYPRRPVHPREDGELTGVSGV